MILKKLRVLAAICVLFAVSNVRATGDSSVDVPVFIILGQSNADGSAMFNHDIDECLESWYTSDANNGKMKIWYRSVKVENQKSNALGETARWAVDGDTVDVAPGWLDLWYRNENKLGRTAMNMIHGYGTYSTGSGTDCAQGRRGIEGSFGQTFATLMPGSELYILKLGVSGSFISSWANAFDDVNWKYFYNNIYEPAILSLIQNGRRPRLAGVWWMQGCADSSKSKEYYLESLMRLIYRINVDLGFKNAPVYIGHIVKPGESQVTPSGSVQFSQNVRDAQDETASTFETVEIVDTKDYSLQYETNFNGYIHFDHAGVVAIGNDLANRIVSAGPDHWPVFSTPGEWRICNGVPEFVPAFGSPVIKYSMADGIVTATIHYPGFDDVKTLEIE